MWASHAPRYELKSQKVPPARQTGQVPPGPLPAGFHLGDYGVYQDLWFSFRRGTEPLKINAFCDCLWFCTAPVSNPCYRLGQFRREGPMASALKRTGIILSVAGVLWFC